MALLLRRGERTLQWRLRWQTQAGHDGGVGVGHGGDRWRGTMVAKPGVEHDAKCGLCMGNSGVGMGGAREACGHGGRWSSLVIRGGGGSGNRMR